MEKTKFSKSEALELLAQAQNGNPQAQYLIGVHLFEQADYLNASYWWNEAINLNRHPLAQYNLALLYEKGIYLKPDIKKAYQLYQDAADQGLAPAQVKIGKWYKELKPISVENDQLALQWLKLAAWQGNADGMFGLAELYCRLKKEYESLYWLTLAAQKKHYLAMYILATTYEVAPVVIDYNRQKAKFWYRKIKSLKIHDENLNALAKLITEPKKQTLHDARKVKKARKKMFLIEQNLAEKGDPEAMFLLGIFYFFGLGTKENNFLANFWWQKAIDNNYERTANFYFNEENNFLINQ